MVIGAGGHGKVVADIARKNNYYDIVFLDDNEQLKQCGSYPIVGKCDKAILYPEADFIIAIGNAKLREMFQKYVLSLGFRVVTLIHPNAVISEDVVIGRGSVVMAGTVVNASTEIGDGCIINTCVSIDHDCKVSDFVHIAVGSHVAGTCIIGKRTWVGAGAIISNNLNVCPDCMIGAGAVVVKDIKMPDTYVGIPAKRVDSRFDQSICISEGNSVQAIKGVIFDLDDTLYSERQYVRSGFHKIGEFLGRADAAEKLWQYFLEGASPINRYLDEISCQEKLEECLDIYRKQKPHIVLYNGASELLLGLKGLGLKIGIITDGRVEGQQNKIAALGLEDIVDDIIITDELGGIQFRKPNDIAFRIMQCRWKMPFEQMVYIGDNLGKDFQAPAQLGMKCLYFRNLDGLYYSDERRGFREVMDIPAMWRELLRFARFE